MKIMILYLFFVSCCSPAIVLSQNVDRIESITEITSTKFKIESQLFQNSRENTLFESEKNNRIGFLKPLSPGTYTSGYILRSDYPWMKNYGVSLALFPLSSASSQNNLLADYIPIEINTFKPGELRGFDISTFWDPGISLFSPNRRFSIDLYKKSSTQIIFNKPGKASPFLLNLHF